MEQKSTLIPQWKERKYLTSNQEISCVFGDGGWKDSHEITIPKGVRCEVKWSLQDGMVDVSYQWERAIIPADRFGEIFGDERVYQWRLQTHHFASLIQRCPFLQEYVIDNEWTKANLFTVKRVVQSDGSKQYLLTISQEYDVWSWWIKAVEHYIQPARTIALQWYQFDRLYGFFGTVTNKKKIRPTQVEMR